MEKIRVCLVGAGRAGKVHALNLKNSITRAKLVAIADENEEAAKKMAEELGVDKYFLDYKEALNWGDFEAVVITSPTFTHRKIAVDMARSGKHIFCEKPMALNLKEAEEMIQEAEESKVKLQIGFMRRFDRGFLEARKKIQEGLIGKPILIKSTGRGPGLPPEWAWDSKKSHGMLAEVVSHDFDSLRWFANSEFKRIYAQAGNYKCPRLKEKYPDFFDHALVMVQFNDGKMGIIDMGCPVGYGYDARMEILGTKGVIFVGETEDRRAAIFVEKGRLVTSTYPSWRDRFRDAYIAEMRHFLQAIREDEEPLVSGEDGKKVIQAVEAANWSIKNGQPVDL